MSGRLAEAVWTDLDSHRPRLLVVPIGSTEQHGPHLPFSTDTDIAIALAAGLVAAREDAVLGPAVPYGSSGEHQAFPGTLSIGRDAVTHLLVELGRSASESFDRVVIVSAHGGNAEPVSDAARLLCGEGRPTLAWSPTWSAGEHAGVVETAVMLALHPERVRAEAAVAGNIEPMVDLLPALVAGGVRGVSVNGVLGDPHGADATMGSELLDRAVADLVATVAKWLTE